MLIHQDNLKMGFEPVGSGVVVVGGCPASAQDGGQCAREA